MKTSVRRKIAIGFLATVLALLMSNMSVFAEDDSVPSIPAAGAHVSTIVKYNKGQTFDLTFGYTATPTVVEVSNNGAGDVVYSQPTAACPEVDITDINVVANSSTVYSSDGIRVPKEDMSDGELAANTQGVITFGESPNTGAAAFPHAGVYAYIITEDTDDTTGFNGNTAGTDCLTYDDAEYLMRVYVVNGVNGLAIQGITFQNEDGDKVTRSNVLFTNTYVETADALEVKKLVAGSGGDQTKQFNFSVNFTAPSSVRSMADGSAWDPTTISVTRKNASGTTVTTDVTVAANGSASFFLAHGEEMIFSNLPAGTNYTVQESDITGGYTPTGQAVQNGQTRTAHVGTRDSNFTSDPTYVGENSNSYTITNTADDITVTGLVINNLPIILLAVLAVAGVFGYRAMRRKMMAR